MPHSSSKKRTLEVEDGIKGRTRPAKRTRKQQPYSSGSSSPSPDEFDPVDLVSSDSETDVAASLPLPESLSPSSVSHSSDSEAPSSKPQRSRTKRHDPSSFALSLSTILASKLSSSKRNDPVLARSKDAHEASHEIAESKLERKARRALRAEKRLASERGRVKDVLLGDRVPTSLAIGASINAGFPLLEPGEQVEEGMSAAMILEQERRLRKTAQRGVVKLFNAVRGAQVRAEEAARDGKKEGLVGTKRREERVGEMGRKAFLELVGGGGVEEA